MNGPVRLLVALVTATLFVVLPSRFALSADAEQRIEPRVVGVVLGEPDMVEFLLAVLETMDLKYAVKPTSEGKSVEWVSNDPVQEVEIRNRLSQYRFIATQCGERALPKPDQAARQKLSCTE